MRIISSFHDYYDSVQSFGQDRSLIYDRKTKEHRYKYGRDYPFPTIISAWTSRPRPSITPYTIGFCGKLYPAIYAHYRFEPKFYFKPEEFDVFINENFKKREREAYLSKKKFSWCFGQKDIKAFFDKHNKKLEEKWKEYFVEHRIPTFVASYDEYNGMLVENEQLKSVDFQRIVDPFTAYQEIQMFMGNLAAPRKEIPAISDADMLEAKGFDKLSFRKEPSKKKVNKT